MTNSDKYDSESWIGFSLRSIVLILIGIVFFVWYVGALLFGVNSLSTLYAVNKYENKLKQKTQSLKIANQKIQKKYFELIQLSNDQ